MNRRDFMVAVTAAGLISARPSHAALFPVHFRKANPYDSLFGFAEPGSDQFRGEKAAVDLEARLVRIFAGLEPPPPALRSWMAKPAQIREARFFVLPGDTVRFEIKTEDSGTIEYHTGIWKLPDFTVVAQEKVSAEKPYFRDVTAHVFGGTPSFQRQLVPGNTYWRARIDSAAGIDVYGNQGIAVGDIDDDGVDEVYVCQPGGLPNRLYKLRPDGTAADITQSAGLDILDETTSAIFADFRNLGRQDLVVLRNSGPLLFLNQGNGTFREQPDAFHYKTPPQGSFTGMAAADYDRDGRLDLYLCCYVYFQSEDQYQFPAPYQDARNGPPNFMFRNQLTKDGGTFEDVTEETGLNENNDRFSFAPAWCDYDGDGWPDLYVANDFGRNNLYRNREGKFRDEAAKAGVEDIGPGMSASWFDYDGDGRPDLYISNMWTAAGQRVVRDPAFKPAAENVEAFRRHTKGNSLYRNRGDGGFEETGPKEGVEMGRWAWGSGGFDFDLDGVPEILVTSGMITNESARDLDSFFWRQVVSQTPATQRAAPEYENGWSAINQMIRENSSWNGREPNVFYVRRDGRYRDCSGLSGIDFADDSRGFAVTDFDGDGNPDIVLKSRRGPQIRAMQNDCAAGRPAIAIRLQGTKSNRDAIGARVEVNNQVQFLAAGSGFLSQSSKRLHFGLVGKNHAEVKIAWPSGLVQSVSDLAPGFTYELVEGEKLIKRTAFRARSMYPVSVIAPNNAPEAANTWLLEPVPTPDKLRGPGFVLLYAGTRPPTPESIPTDAIDLQKDNGDLAAAYAIFRRYLFEYRTGLELPLMLLIDAESRVHRFYASLPSEKTMREDLTSIAQSAKLALPFPGRYYSDPRRSYFKMGAAFYWAGYPDRALPYLRESLRAKPDNWRALIAIGRIQQELGNSADALHTFQNVMEIRPDYVPVIVNAGEAYLNLHDMVNAKKMFARAIELDPQSSDAANQLGVLAAEANDFAAARQWFQRAIAARRDHSVAINNLGVLYARMGQPKDAIAALRYGIEVAPGDETLYLNLGRIYVTMGEREQARAVLVQLLEREPGNAIATKGLAELEGR